MGRNGVASVTAEDHLERLQEAETSLMRRMERDLLRLVEDDDYVEKDWTVIYDAEKGGRSELVDTDKVAEFRRKCRWMYWQGSEFVRRIVRNAINYVVGPGYNATVTGVETPEVRKQVNDFWVRWCRHNKWPAKQRETVERGTLDGEIFLRWAVKNDMLIVRFLEPEDINDPTPGSRWTLGVRYSTDDVEDVEAYAWNPKHSTSEPQDWLPPALLEMEGQRYNGVQHIFWFGTPSMVRCYPPLIPILNRVKQYEGWLTDRLVLNKLRARIALLRRHMKAAPSQIKEFADAQKDGETRRSAKTGTAMDRRKMYKPGTILDVSGSTEYEFLTPNVQASDVRYDGREVKLAFATGAGQSEVMVTADASNANFASTWIAEAPPVKEFETLQAVFSEESRQVWHRVMMWGQDTGRIPVAPDRDDAMGYSGYDVLLEPPTLVTRDRLDDTKANQMMYVADALSRKTWMSRDGLDVEQETENLKEEKAEDVELGHEDDGDLLDVDDDDDKDKDKDTDKNVPPNDEGDE
jgi:hypothetical protein